MAQTGQLGRRVEENTNRIKRLTESPTSAKQTFSAASDNYQQTDDPNTPETDAAILDHSELDQEQEQELPARTDYANTAHLIAAKLNAEQDSDRVRVGASLVNVFNYAIQVQAKRNNWTEADFRAFIIAFQATDGIGVEHVANTNSNRVASDVEAQLNRVNTKA